MARLILFNKPYNVLSCFTDKSGRPTLAAYITEADIYPAGRLDRDSEGLLLLTDDGALQHRISDPGMKMPKTYWVQVEGKLTQDALNSLRTGIRLKSGLTLPAKAGRIPEPAVWKRDPPIRKRDSVATSWLELTITEGRNRQVRQMTAAVGFPTLRLIRYRIGPWSLDNLKPGELRKLAVHLPVGKANQR